MTVAAVFAAACGLTETVIADLSGDADSLHVSGVVEEVLLLNPDTIVGPSDTVVISRVDTIIQPPDTVLISFIDTVEVSVVDTVIVGTDTTFVSRIDTLVTTRVDTVATVDTIIATIVDTIIETDTLIVADTVFVQTRLVAARGSQPLASGLTIDSGATATLSVTAQNPLEVPTVPSQVTWLSDAPGTASVSGTTSTGTVRGVRPGTANIFAIAAGLAATVPTTVRRLETLSPPPPPPANSQSRFFRAHEPSGMTPVSERSFSALRENWTEDFDGIPERIVLDGNGPHSPGSAMQFVFREGASGGGELRNRGTETFPPQDVLYVYLTWKLSANWQGHESLVNKQFYIRTANPIGAGWNTYVLAKGRNADPLRLWVHTQDSPTGDNPIYPPNVGDGTLNRGQWYEFEFVFTANTPGARDGRLEVWKNGVKVIDVGTFGPVDVGEGPGFSAFGWAPIWGGLGDVIEQEMYSFLDHIYISGK
jgi:hypothetical protein